ncbi:MAG TPA: T9SS type A sorting domain-containing protein [Bacteroidia bacterium]
MIRNITKTVLLSSLLFTASLASAQDVIPPSITLNNGKIQKIQISVNTNYNEPKSVTDDQTDSADIIVSLKWGSTGQFNPMVRSVYVLYITAIDESNNMAYDTVTFNVDDFIAPVINLNTEDKICILRGTPYTRVTPTVTDNYYGSNNVTLTLKSSDVNVSVIGFYEDVYEAIDASGNITIKKRIVEVSNDCGSTVSVQGIEAQTLSVYPNPANNKLEFSLDLGPDALIQIVDLNGKSVFNSAFSKSTDISQIPNGIYVVWVYDNQQYHRNLIQIVH